MNEREIADIVAKGLVVAFLLGLVLAAIVARKSWIAYNKDLRERRVRDEGFFLKFWDWTSPWDSKGRRRF